MDGIKCFYLENKTKKIKEMAKESKVVTGIKLIKQMEKKHIEKTRWCKEHNMELQRQWHWEMAEEMRRLSMQMEDHFGTRYISFNWES